MRNQLIKRRGFALSKRRAISPIRFYRRPRRAFDKIAEMVRRPDFAEMDDAEIVRWLDNAERDDWETLDRLKDRGP